MPMKREDYPPDWEEISLRIRQRENWRCKWCDVPHGAVGKRDRHGKWWSESEIAAMNSAYGMSLFGSVYPRMIKIVLTVAHLGVDKPGGVAGDKHDKMDCRDENLAALCQRCHLNFDRPDHIRNARRTRLQKKLAVRRRSGQLDLFKCII